MGRNWTAKMGSMRRWSGIALMLLVVPALAQPPESIGQLEADARNALAAHNIDQAIADYQKIARMLPGGSAAVFQDKIGFLSAASGRTPEAIDHFRRAIKLDPKMAQAWFHLGAALMLSGDQQAGIQALEKAAALNPSPEYRYRLGVAYNDVHQYAKAIPLLEQAADTMGMSKNEAVWEALGIACQQQKNWTEARHAYEHALKLDPKNNRIRDSYGYVLAKSGAIAQAIAQFQQILKQEPEDIHAQVNLGFAYIGAGQYKSAIAYLSRVVLEHPEDPSAHYNLAVAYKLSDDSPHAIAEFKRAIELDPSLADANFLLGNTYLAEGEPKKAIEQYRAAVAHKPDYADAWYQLGMTLKEQGDTDGAVDAMRHSVALNANDAGAFNTLGLLLRRKGDLKGSNAAFAKAAALRASENARKQKELEQGMAKLKDKSK